MKRPLAALIFALITSVACNNNADTDAKEDSIAADRAADSMLEAATSANTMALDSAEMDTSGTDSLKLQNNK